MEPRRDPRHAPEKRRPLSVCIVCIVSESRKVSSFVVIEEEKMSSSPITWFMICTANKKIGSEKTTFAVRQYLSILRLENHGDGYGDGSCTDKSNITESQRQTKTHEHLRRNCEGQVQYYHRHKGFGLVVAITVCQRGALRVLVCEGPARGGCSC